MFWQCIACMHSLLGLLTSTDIISLGHHRLWVNGIHHGDISYNNLMYNTSTKTNKPVGIVNDFDLATWVNHSTTNNNCTGTIPFMAIDLLDGGLDGCTPRLYRHNMESFVWLLAYITVAEVVYKDHTIEISPPPQGVNTWFMDYDFRDCRAHISSKRLLYRDYEYALRVSGHYFGYFEVVKVMTWYWSNFHNELYNMKHIMQPKWLTPMAQEPITHEEDNPAHTLRVFVEAVGKSLGEGNVQKRFEKVKTLLLGVIDSTSAAVQIV